MIPEYWYDYCLPGDEMGYRCTVLVGKERFTGSRMATTVPQKRGEGRFVADKYLEHMAENGDKAGNVIVKRDQENSISYLLEQIVEI